MRIAFMVSGLMLLVPGLVTDIAGLVLLGGLSTYQYVTKMCIRDRSRGGPYNIQLSGGEPTMRDDLPEIVRLGRERGFSFFQLNTNGLRLASEKGYAEELRAAGVSCAFLQFDGLRPGTYETVSYTHLDVYKRQA